MSDHFITPDDPHQPSLIENCDWKLLATIHEYAKEVFLYAEEFDINTFVQPFNEIRNAHEHLMRAVVEDCQWWGQQENPERDIERIQKNMQQAIGHQYRAFFDASDWLSLRIREEITVILKPYSVNVKSQAIPEYMKKRALFEGFNSQIAKLRDAKDIGEH